MGRGNLTPADLKCVHKLGIDGEENKSAKG